MNNRILQKINATNAAAFCILILCLGLGLSNLTTQRLISVDADTLVYLPGIFAGSHTIMWQHPAQTLLFAPVMLAVKIGIPPLTSLQILFGSFLCFAVAAAVTLGRLLFDRWDIGFLLGAAFSLTPTIQVLTASLEDNVLNQAFLMFALGAAYGGLLKKNLPLIMLSGALFGIVVSVAFSTLVWGPFYAALVALAMRGMERPVRVGLLGLASFCFALLAVSLTVDACTGTSFSTPTAFQDVVKEMQHSYATPPEVISKTDHDLYLRRFVMDPARYFWVTMADPLLGYFRISGKSLMQENLGGARASKALILITTISIAVSTFLAWRRNNKQTAILCTVIVSALGYHMVAVYLYRDNAYYERFDFFPMLFPFLVWGASCALPSKRLQAFLAAVVCLLYIGLGGVFYAFRDRLPSPLLDWAGRFPGHYSAYVYARTELEEVTSCGYCSLTGQTPLFLLQAGRDTRPMNCSFASQINVAGIAPAQKEPESCGAVFVSKEAAALMRRERPPLDPGSLCAIGGKLAQKQ
ncbi:MAG: hypothetical protein HY042_04425 [Spirochaetia bacterium]|nr:hypothetical protein [Spirochaetia bacterium]